MSHTMSHEQTWCPYARDLGACCTIVTARKYQQNFLNTIMIVIYIVCDLNCYKWTMSVYDLICSLPFNKLDI